MPTLVVNGMERSYDGDPEMPLLWYLRDELGMTGTKFGCGIAPCGACTVHLDGTAVRSCQAHVGDVDGQTVITIEGLSPDGNHPVQKAWRELNVAQCGYCQTGQIMQAASLLKDTPKPTRRADRRRHERQHLPLRHLSAHPRRHQARPRKGGRTMTNHHTNSRTSPPLGPPRSRRGILRALGPPARARPGAGEEIWRRRHAGRREGRPELFLSIADDGTVNLLPPRRDGPGHPHQLGHGGRRRARSRLGRKSAPQAPGDEARYGNQDTDGSRSMRHLQPLRRIAAAARQMLEQAAARAGACRSPRSRRRTTASSMPASGRRSISARWPRARRRGRCRRATTLVLKGPCASSATSARTSAGSIDNLDITTGKAVFGIDARVDGMAMRWSRGRRSSAARSRASMPPRR